MYVRPHRAAPPPRVTALLVAFTACMLFTGSAADAAARGDVVVVSVRGAASVTMAGMTVPLSAGAILQLPATVRTGPDGALELRQGSSTFAVAADTELEIPQSAAQDGLIERIIQIRGNAFYNVGKRTRTRLRVETPYLVAVIKGTQFNVASQENGTTVALFEGHLEVHAADQSDVVDLHAGEIAIRNRSDVSISVLRLTAMRDDLRRHQAIAARPQFAATAGDRSEIAPRSENTTDAPATTLTEQADAGETTASVSTSNDLANGVVAATVDATVFAGNLDPGAVAALDLGTPAVNAGAPAAIDLASRSIAVDSSIGARLGSASAGIAGGAAMNTGTEPVTPAVVTSTTPGVGGAEVDVDVGPSGDTATAGIGAVAELGNAQAAARVSAAVGTGGAGSVDASSGVAADLDVQAGVNAGHGSPSVTVALGADIERGAKGPDPGLDLQDEDADSDDAGPRGRRGRPRQ